MATSERDLGKDIWERQFVLLLLTLMKMKDWKRRSGVPGPLFFSNQLTLSCSCALTKLGARIVNICIWIQSPFRVLFSPSLLHRWLLIIYLNDLLNIFVQSLSKRPEPAGQGKPLRNETENEKNCPNKSRLACSLLLNSTQLNSTLRLLA